ncbi:MAG: hypothetical protein FJ206_08360 [Gemmatimonadetes bacterium]|nr:hypothetical protein [Gemmatimonadota bacterium]
MRWFLSLVLLVGFAVPVVGQDSVKTKKRKRDPNVITLEEIDAIRSELSNAYEIVSRLRPQYLRGRGSNSFGNARGGKAVPLAKIVVDGSPYGEVTSLNQISAMMVREIRYLGSGDASIKYGTGYDGGAILVSTR